MTKQQALIDIIGLITALTVGVIMAIKGLAYWALAAQTVIQVSMSAILKFIIVPWKPTWEFDFSPLKPMLTFSSKLLATSVFSQVNSNIFSVVFGKFYNADQLGVYNQGQKWMWMGNQFIGGMINYVTQPVLAQVTENRERQENILRKLIRFGAFLSFPLMLGLAFVGKEFILIALGEKWLPSVPFLQLFCLWGAFGFLSTLYTNLIYTKGKSNLFMYGTIITGFLQLIVIVCMYPFGVFPMVIAYILMFFAGLGIWQFYVYKLTGLRLRDVLKDILSYLFITLGCFFIAWLLTKSILNVYFLFVTKILISGFLYLAVMKISKSVIFQESMDFLLQAVKTFFHSTHL
jgi:O-antigen/teichoic acid export membrane protein